MNRALGLIVEAVSHSKFWSETAIFVLEDDAQNGPDHVDAHRMPALVISPWTKRHVVDSTLYSTTSMLRTMELILGLQPMSQFDAAATPMWASFADAVDLASFSARPAQVDLEARNTKLAWARANRRRWISPNPTRSMTSCSTKWSGAACAARTRRCLRRRARRVFQGAPEVGRRRFLSRRAQLTSSFRPAAFAWPRPRVGSQARLDAIDRA